MTNKNKNVKRTYLVELDELNDGTYKMGTSLTVKRINQHKNQVVRVDARNLARAVNTSKLVIK